MPGEIVPIPNPSLASIAASTLLIVMVGEEDVVVGDLRGRQIFAQATAIPPVEKAIHLVPIGPARLPAADRRAHSAQRASFPARQRRGSVPGFQMRLGEVNALDRAGFWRMADLTMEAAFAGKTLDDATRDEEQFRHLGFWSDGRKVIQPIVGIRPRFNPPRRSWPTACAFSRQPLGQAESTPMNEGVRR